MSKPSCLQIWIQAARPKTLWASVAPAMMGMAMAFGDGVFQWLPACVALVCAISVQIGSNFCNDLSDTLKGADTAERQGPVRATQAGWVTPRQMRVATTVALSLTALCYVYLVARGGWPMLLLAFVSIAVAVLYTAGPFPLAYHGLGDVFVFVFFGPLAVAATYYVQALACPLYVPLAGIGAGCLATGILVVNNIRDMKEDASTGKRTLVVRFGLRLARMEYTFCFLIAWLLPTWLVLVSQMPYTVFLLWLLLWPAWRCLKTVWTTTEASALNPLLGRTAKLLLLYALVFSIAWVSA